jgi:radical SAM protein
MLPTGASPLPPTATRPGQPVATADFGRAPFLVVWEVTRACALACLHCRADAIARRHPSELTTAEAIQLVNDIRSFGDQAPLLVLTGGDPMRRPDLARIVGYAASLGLTVALTPSGTAAATRTRLEELRDAGLSRLAVSLDGPTPEQHDAFRGVRGSYAWTMRIIESAGELGIPLQINSTLGRLTYPHLRALADRVATLPIVLWAVFFLIQTGRGQSLEQIDSVECEEALQFLRDLSARVPFGIKTTEAPHYQRVRLQTDASRPSRVPQPPPATGSRLRAPRGVNDGNGFLFVDHLGAICPSGFLPLTRGNVREHSLVTVYRDDPVFQQLRDPDSFTGKCGWCEFRHVCGGSRARAYAATGSPFASDPLCAYVPELGVRVRAASRTA